MILHPAWGSCGAVGRQNTIRELELVLCFRCQAYLPEFGSICTDPLKGSQIGFGPLRKVQFSHSSVWRHQLATKAVDATRVWVPTVATPSIRFCAVASNESGTYACPEMKWTVCKPAHQMRALHPSPAQRPSWPPVVLRTFCLPQFSHVKGDRRS